MGRTFKGYINYGCLSKEKRQIFTAESPKSTATVSEPVEYTVPEGWEVGENIVGDVIITAPWGWDYRPNELLEGKENPYFAGINDEKKGFRVPLEWKKI